MSDPSLPPAVPQQRYTSSYYVIYQEAYTRHVSPEDAQARCAPLARSIISSVDVPDYALSTAVTCGGLVRRIVSCTFKSSEET
eukprot:1168574-Prymnesium_polylepis.1